MKSNQINSSQSPFPQPPPVLPPPLPILSVPNEGNPFGSMGFVSLRPATAVEEFRKLVAEVKQQKAVEKEQEPEILDVPKCDLHPVKLSNNCRTCKKNKSILEELEKKREDEKKKTDLSTMIKYAQNNPPPPPPKTEQKPINIFPIWGDSNSYNINPLLRNNILNSQYFKDLYLLKFYNEIIDEICKKSTHVEPWTPGSNGIPSTLFCCLYKFMLMKLTLKQVKLLLEFSGNPYVRCVGFLYIRYCCSPDYLWDWLSKYLLDDEELHPSADPKVVTTIGDYVEALIKEMNYYQTRFPRIPTKTDRILKAKLLIMSEKRERKRINWENLHLFQKGIKIKALSQQDEDWHIGIVEKVEGKFVKVKFLIEDPNNTTMGDGILKLKMLEEQFKGNAIFYGGEENVSLADIYILTEEEEQFELDRKKKEILSQMTPSKSKSVEKEKSLKNDSDSEHKKKKNRSKSDEESDSSSSKKKKQKKHKHHSKKSKHKKKRSKSKNKSRSRSRRRSKSRSRSRSKSHRRSRSISRSKDKSKKEGKKQQTAEEKYLEEVIRREKNEALANCKADYSKRPTSYKTSLSNPLPSGSIRTRSRSPSPLRKEETFVKVYAPKVEDNKEKKNERVQLSQSYILRMKKLKESYGDASANAKLFLDKLDGEKIRRLDEEEILKLG